MNGFRVTIVLPLFLFHIHTLWPSGVPTPRGSPDVPLSRHNSIYCCLLYLEHPTQALVLMPCLGDIQAAPLVNKQPLCHGESRGKRESQ